MKLILREIAENIDLENLGHNWREFDFESFSENKKLYDFQKKALENILKLLWFYYEKCFDFKKDEDLSMSMIKEKKNYLKNIQIMGFRKIKQIIHIKKKQSINLFLIIFH
jgi:hypothetical protein